MENNGKSMDMINWEAIDEVESIELVLKENPEMACMMSRKNVAY